MNATEKICAAAILILAPTAGALAATGSRGDSVGILVWAFLGFCALIVAVQVIPAVFMMVNAVRGVAAGVRERRRATAESEVRA